MAASLEQVMKDINTAYKGKIVNKGVVFEKLPLIPFSSPRMNYMTYGGLPLGRIVEFSGAEGGGKTTTALDVVQKAQKMLPDKTVLYVDVERTFDPEWAAKIGVDVDSLILLTPESQSAEQIFEMVKSIIETGSISVAVIDSFGVMVSSQAYKKTLEEKTYAGISQALTIFGNQMVPICARTKCLLIGINQLRDDMNSAYGGTKTLGGRAWKHLCSVRLEFTKSDYLDESGSSLSRSCESPVGHLVKVALIKSKVAKMNRKIGSYTLNYLDGIDVVSDIIDVGVKEGLVATSGAWYYLIDAETKERYKDVEGKDLKFQGKARLHEFLVANPEWRDDINEQILLKFV